MRTENRDERIAARYAHPKAVSYTHLQNVLIVMGISTFWQNLIFGVILLIAIFIDKYRRKAGGEE